MQKGCSCTSSCDHGSSNSSNADHMIDKGATTTPDARCSQVHFQHFKQPIQVPALQSRYSSPELDALPALISENCFMQMEVNTHSFLTSFA